MFKKGNTGLLQFLICLTFSSCALVQAPIKSPVEWRQSGWVTSDIDRFYQAFDLAREQPENAKKIFNRYYFQKGSKGLKDFYKLKIRSKEKFADFVINYQGFYQSIRADVIHLEDLSLQVADHLVAFQQLYPKATYPKVYFLIGKFQSNGTISKSGLLIGTEILSRTSRSDTTEWNQALLELSLDRGHIPVTVTHELIHFNQNDMAEGNTLLWKSIREGSAEFIAELITGQTDGDYREFKGREWEVWEDFKTDKDKSIWNSWQKGSEQRPQNAGYWMGYTICKAYFHQIGQDKKRAVQDILQIQNYEEFLEKSQVEEFLLNLRD